MNFWYVSSQSEQIPIADAHPGCRRRTHYATVFWIHSIVTRLEILRAVEKAISDFGSQSGEHMSATGKLGRRVYACMIPVQKPTCTVAYICFFLNVWDVNLLQAHPPPSLPHRILPSCPRSIL